MHEGDQRAQEEAARAAEEARLAEEAAAAATDTPAEGTKYDGGPIPKVASPEEG